MAPLHHLSISVWADILESVGAGVFPPNAQLKRRQSALMSPSARLYPPRNLYLGDPNGTWRAISERSMQIDFLHAGLSDKDWMRAMGAEDSSGRSV
ncbi:hypothetical protein AVEN_186117-1 [Araneus ventricosus]|uniref:Uncharacterized protein n=1 Tax=Araneus ventricosus TaxID=182803 RepID=A0A4Y2VCH2_ARAVE|nr:hypothetical protein AVEN_186117-1 [Araneus ventricosus]